MTAYEPELAQNSNLEGLLTLMGLPSYCPLQSGRNYEQTEVVKALVNLLTIFHEC